MSEPCCVDQSSHVECAVCKTFVCPTLGETVATPRGTVCIWCHNIINRWACLSPLTREAVRLGARLASPLR
jgi:hypothetical protein